MWNNGDLRPLCCQEYHPPDQVIKFKKFVYQISTKILTNAGLETDIDVVFAHTVIWNRLAKRHQRAYIIREKVYHT